MNPQEIYDTVKKHLLTQMAKSVHPVEGYCMYRNPNGLKCAVGCLIPDELYDLEMDTAGKGLSVILQNFSLPLWMRENIGLLLDLQRLHDGSEVRRWVNEVQTVAHTYGLNP